ncbi:MAG: insulinase family protein [Gemmatimonadetes bacterium]|nr:insulinase family protein [Gemmatimonadota bacterium]
MKRSWLALALGASLGSTGMQAQDVRIDVPYTQFVLPNGLNVILHQDHTTPTVSVNVWYHVGSAREKPGRTGFAHLFEHIMFEGSGHVAEGNFDQWLEAAGGNNNGSTANDRTDYWEDVPRNALELALFLESDRMGYLLQSMSPAKVDGQRDVVKNERRQSYENQPYGMASIALSENLYPANHPYHWPTIGYMDDLTAASYQDVVGFFKSYYGPNNASLAIAGDIDPAKTRVLVEKWFGDVPPGQPVAVQPTPAAVLAEEKRVVMEDRVQLPRLYMAWLTPGLLQPGDAEMDVLANVLGGGKNSRLYQRLVYDLQIAQDVSAFQLSSELGSAFRITATARPGHTLSELEQEIQEELDRIKRQPPSARELGRAVNQYEAGFLDQMEQVGGFGGKADQLNHYYTYTGNPDYFNEDLSRYQALDPADVTAMAARFLRDDARVVLSVVPQGKPELQAQKRKTSQ